MSWFRRRRPVRTVGPVYRPGGVIPSRGAYVYWLHDAAGRVFYIGSTVSLDARLRQHRQRWYGFTHAARWFDSEADARAYEAWAIRSHPTPLANVQHNPRSRVR